ncbi:tetratricopeptide repeat protein [Billgrantia lactosivorans]|uniref:tetratricopeptide repeat protein n=1 Tax=Billgrantia lactosivorans TaxID=2185141 RepID=UPI001FE32BEF|nr:tetratricopeptide repeat protein [Halomonas lactosivorans]
MSIRAVMRIVTSLGWLLAAAAQADAPALPGDIIADLERLQTQLQRGEPEGVSERARSQATRLESGNAADRWASALYRQLAAGADSRAGRHGAAAEQLRQARRTEGAPQAQRDRWLREEARLRLAAGQTEQAATLLRDWHQRHDGSPDDRWRLARALAELERWDEAADWVERALADEPDPDDRRQALAMAVFQRAGRGEQALAHLEASLDAQAEPEAWRRAAALAQGLGEARRAAAIWEAGWRLGALAGESDLRRRIELHLAAGTPARAAEMLEAALGDGVLSETLAERRLLARAWEQARDRERALAAWREVARRSGQGEDWRRLGLLAHAWGRLELAQEALQQAQARGVEIDERWLSTR